MKRIALLLAVISLFAGCRKEVLPEAVALNRHSIALEIGETAVLEATVTPANATNPALSWSSTQPSVATVDPDGKVTALSEGQAIITVATVAGTKTDACSVTVTKKATPDPEHDDTIEGVTISPSTLEVGEGRTAQLKATVSPASAAQDVEWASQSTAIATVDASGLVTGVSKGTTKIYARSKANPDKQATCAVTVIQDPTLLGISFTVTEVNLTVGQTYTLSIIYSPEYAANKKVSWKSSDAGVAAVSSEGIITGLSEGTTTVTATSVEGGFTASCAVTVSKSAGTKVYYSINVNKENCPLYLNGEPDPLNGAFSEIAAKGSAAVRIMCTDGADLYTIERSSEDGYYLCKNRKPVCKIQYEKSLGYPSFYSMSIRNGTVAVLTKFDDEVNKRPYMLSVIRSDGTFTLSEMEGEYSDIRHWRCAWAPNGNLIVAAGIKDPFGDYWLATYTYSPDGKWSEKRLAKEYFNSCAIDITEDGDVYIMAIDQDSNKKGIVVLYKNGEKHSVFGELDTHNSNVAMHISGGHIYAAVHDINECKIKEYLDGTLIRTLTFDDINSVSWSSPRPLYVTSSGDMYLETKYCIYKNDAKVFTAPGGDYNFDQFCVIE
ncbi:MAG: Ig-like domain-containing protein [Bacteroidales bacterium]|nr:Ig-like domain-containing protein [Bacteroidales bacterium]